MKHIYRIFWIAVIAVLLLLPVVLQAQVSMKVTDIAKLLARDLLKFQITTFAMPDVANQDNNYTGLSRYLAEEIISRLEATRKFKIPDVKQVAEVMARNNMNHTALNNPDKLSALGKDLGVELIAVASYREVPAGISVKILLTGVGGEVIATEVLEFPKDAFVEKKMNEPLIPVAAPPTPPVQVQKQVAPAEDVPPPPPVPPKSPEPQKAVVADGQPDAIPTEEEKNLIQTRMGDFITVQRSKSASTFNAQTCKDKIGANIGVFEDWGGRKDVLMIHPPSQSDPAFIEFTTVIPNDGLTYKLVVNVQADPNGDCDAQVIARDAAGNTTELQPKKAILPNQGWNDWVFPLDNFRGKRVTFVLYDWASGWHYEGLYVDRFHVWNGKLR
jgi:hypothetical protein